MDLESARNRIQKIDMQIIDLIKKRQECARDICKGKICEKIPVRDEVQRDAVLRRAFKTAEKEGLNPELTRKIFEILIEMNEEKQTELNE
ncbi:chorismate mutase [Methanomicrobium sp. W14]|uniref:chorismate mutase n=1 Tax=Methanomicrobium sp. W14 TaxID=2817839 RepID=UPI001AE9E881|nr:chorismate mutase [Methanomicrobium sp. W14]MBP2134301.1 chorismate mutase [Methanomicrobium sp. W14]